MVYNKNGMSYKKRYNYRKRRYNYNKTTYYKANKALSLARKAQSQKELKWLETDQSYTVTNVGRIQNIFVLPVGDTNNTREGNVVYPTSVNFKGVLTMNASTTGTVFRIIVFRWLTGAPPSLVTQILNTTNIEAFKSDSDRYLSDILFDRTYTVSVGTSPVRYIKFKRKCKGLTAFQDGTNVSNKNGYNILFISDEDTNLPTINYTTRIYFKDA